MVVILKGIGANLLNNIARIDSSFIKSIRGTGKILYEKFHGPLCVL